MNTYDTEIRLIAGLHRGARSLRDSPHFATNTPGSAQVVGLYDNRSTDMIDFQGAAWRAISASREYEELGLHTLVAQQRFRVYTLMDRDHYIDSVEEFRREYYIAPWAFDNEEY